MAGASPRKRPPRTVRRLGYVIAAVVNGGLLYAVNRWPGWQSLGFLTDETSQVLDLVNLSVLSGLIVNLAYLSRDPPWLKALGDLVTTSVGFTAALRVWQIFPFDFTHSTYDGTAVTRILVVVAIAGSAIGILAAVISFVRSLLRAPS